MSSHDTIPVTTSLPTVTALALVHSERPNWVAVGVGEARAPRLLAPSASADSRPASRDRSPTSSSLSPEGAVLPK
jgi:hypothetical protein